MLKAFRERIEIKEPTKTISENGFETLEYTLLKSVRACLKYPSMRKKELLKDSGVDILNLVEFTFRKINLNVDYVISHNNLTYEIKEISGDSRYTTILCSKVD